MASSVEYHAAASTPPSTSVAVTQPAPTAADPHSLKCATCKGPITSQYVRPLGAAHHPGCFRCMDCNEIVTAKFFSFTLPDSRQVPLCEVDYFRRLDLLCAKCGQALRGSYITASDKKYHVQHFTCSCCSTLFGPQDSYYEHQNAQGVDVYCHYHYSTRCAQKCASCQTAILRQFVEVNRSSRDEAYHLPCHLIQKFWNVKIGAPLAITAGNQEPWTVEESLYTPATLRSSQKRMDELVHRVWTVLSAYEESSAACISDLLKAVSTAVYLEAIRSAERFIFHVEVLFAALDDLEFHFEAYGAPTVSYSSATMSNSSLSSTSSINLKGMAHVRETRVLCRKTVDLFTALSHAQKDISRQGMTQDLHTLITGIAHYLKILLRIALLAALRIMREYNDAKAVKIFLDQLQRLMEESGDPLASRQATEAGHMGERANGSPPPGIAPRGGTKVKEPVASLPDITFEGRPLNVARSREGVAFGFKSLDPEVTGNSPYAQEYFDLQNGTRIAAEFVPPSDLCIKCNTTIENNCIRLGTYTRWHLHCLACDVCGCVAGPKAEAKEKAKDAHASTITSKSVINGENEKEEEYTEVEVENARRETRARLNERLRVEAEAEAFTFTMGSNEEKAVESEFSASLDVPGQVYCPKHRPSTGESRLGFKTVSRLEQYSYLLNVALLRLYSILKRRGAIQPPTEPLRRRTSSPRESIDMVRLRSVSLDRKSTSVKTPRRLTIIESPVGRTAQTTQVSDAAGIPGKSPPKQSQKPPTPPGQQKPSTPPSQHQKPISPPSSPSKRGVVTSSPPSPKRSEPLRTASPPPASGNEPDGLKIPSNAEAVSIASITESDAPPTSSAKPSFKRMNSQVVVMEDVSILQGSQLDLPVRSSSPIAEEPNEDERESLRLADLSSLMEGDHRSVLSAGSGLDTPFLSDLDQADGVLVKHAALWLLNHSELKDKFDADDVLEGIEVRKGGLWNKFFKAEKKVKKRGVFGVPLDLLTEKHGVESTLGVTRNLVRIPTFLDDIISTMKQMDVSVEGIFRKNGNIRRVKEAIDALDREPDSLDFSQENAIQLAALLKKYFIELPDPLLTHRLHAVFVATQTVTDEAERSRLLHLASTLLPKYHRNTMEVFFAFLKWVALFSNIDSAGSKMDIQNLSTVIAPSILASKNYDPLLQNFAAIAVVVQMLKEQDRYNRVPEECLEVLAEKKFFAGYESSKDLLKRCEKHFRGKSSVKSPIASPTAIHFAPGTLQSQKSETSLENRGRPFLDKRAGRDSKSLERREPRERSNTLRKPKPALNHSPFSMPSSLGSNGSFSKLPTDSFFANLSSLSPAIRGEAQPSMHSPHVPTSIRESPPLSNGHLL